VRGLSSVLILSQLSEALAYHGLSPSTHPPWRIFDLICGTSTGGLLALMLGRLRMSIKECLKAYEELAKEIFTYGFVRRFGRWIRIGRQFRGAKLEARVRRIVKGVLGDEDALLYDPDSMVGGAKVYVPAIVLPIIRLTDGIGS
jgi:hypothetical protein